MEQKNNYAASLPIDNPAMQQTVPVFPIVVLIITMAVVGFTTGSTIPTVSLRLHDWGFSDLVIGVFAAAPALGNILVIPFVGRLHARYGRKPLILAGLSMSAISIFLLQYLDQIGPWFVLRLLMGMAGTLIFTMGESWINNLVHDGKRGRVIACYTTAFTVFQLLGPTVVGLMGAHNDMPLLLAAALHIPILCLLSVVRTSDEVLSHELSSLQPAQSAMTIKDVIWSYPFIYAGVLFFSFFDGTILSLFPVYALAEGYPVAVATFMVSLILAGDAIMQSPLGWLADHVSRRPLYIGCGAGVILLCAVLPWAMHTYWLWPVLVVLGAVSGGIYTLALVQVGQFFTGKTLVVANTVVSLMWGLGCLFGPLLTGLVSNMGAQALPMVLCAVAVVFVLVARRQPA